MFEWFQKLGKSLLLPVAVMPVCAIFMGIGYAICPELIQTNNLEAHNINVIIASLLTGVGSAILDNIGIVFAIGVAVGMAKKSNGTAALAAAIVMLIIITFSDTKRLSFYEYTTSIPDWSLAYKGISKNALLGIISGLIGSGCYNKFSNVKLPNFLSFFSGKRCVTIIASFFGLLMAIFMVYVWPFVFRGIFVFGQWIASLGETGVGFYMFFNRLLIPLGLHHALNNVFWFDTAGLGDITNFWAGNTSADVGWDLGSYMSGFFPCVMFGIAGAALAIVLCSKKKKETLGAISSMVLCAFLCGVTEPFEFMFMFLCFPLYVIYALLYGIFGFITTLTGFRAGFSFSSGLIDLILSSSLPAANDTWLIIPLGLLAFVVFFLAFYLFIKLKKTNFQNSIASKSSSNSKTDYVSYAKKLLEACGGIENIKETDHCVTRLRLILNDGGLVNEDAVNKAGANGIIRPTDHACQIVIGTDVQFVYDEFIKLTGK